MSDGKRWWIFPKILSSVSIWRYSNDEQKSKSKVTQSRKGQTILENAKSRNSSDEEDIEEFIEKQRNARLGYTNDTPFHSVQRSEEYSSSKERRTSNGFQRLTKKFRRSNSDRNYNRSVSKISAASTKYTSSGISISENEISSTRDVATFMSCERSSNDIASVNIANGKTNGSDHVAKKFSFESSEAHVDSNDMTEGANIEQSECVHPVKNHNHTKRDMNSMVDGDRVNTANETEGDGIKTANEEELVEVKTTSEAILMYEYRVDHQIIDRVLNSKQRPSSKERHVSKLTITLNPVVTEDETVWSETETTGAPKDIGVELESDANTIRICGETEKIIMDQEEHDEDDNATKNIDKCGSSQTLMIGTSIEHSSTEDHFYDQGLMLETEKEPVEDGIHEPIIYGDYTELDFSNEGSEKCISEESNDAVSMEYCQQLAKMDRDFRRNTLKRFGRKKPSIVRVNDGITKAWKSLRGWWIDEKAKIEQVVIKTHNKISKRDDVAAYDSDSVKSLKSSYDYNRDEYNRVGSSRGDVLSFQTDDESYCTSLKTVGSSSDIIDADQISPHSFRPQSCYADIGDTDTIRIQRRNPPHPPPSRTSEIGAFRKSRYILEGQDGFEELRRYIKQGGDFCKDLSVILQERSDAEIQYAKALSKLSSKLLKVAKDSIGSVNQAWQKAALEMEITGEIHRTFATALSEEVVKPLKQLLESQHRIRKSVEATVDKTSKSLCEWRSAESKSKKQSFVYARENEKLQDLMLDARLNGTLTSPCKLTASTLHLHQQRPSSEKEYSKLEAKRKKAEECVKKSDVEYYTYCIRAEKARLEWETAVVRGSHCFQALEEERLQRLKNLAYSYWQQCEDIGPKLTQSALRLKEPIENCDVNSDIKTIAALKGIENPLSEQILPDFYAEHITLAMNRDRRRQALVKILQLIIHDLERERRGKHGVENLARAFKQTPTFGTDDSQQNVCEKLHHMRFMLTYLEAARYKVTNALAEVDGKPKASHPLASHIHVVRDKQGFQQSILKVPPWVHKDYIDNMTVQIESSDWSDRGDADGNSVQPDSDFDEFSSQGSSEKDYESNLFSVLSDSISTSPSNSKQCKALYHYSANLYDELNLQPGDVINIHEKQPDGWWLGELNGVIGIFPATYVQEIS